MVVTVRQLLCVCGVALLSATCGGDTSPTSPTPIASMPPPAAAPPTPAATGKLEVSIVPNPVPFSGQPISDVASCATSKNTWFYEQILREVGGAEVTLRSRVDKFDGSTVNDLVGLSIVVPASGSTTLRSRWCSTTAVEHSAQTSFGGTDEHGNNVLVTGPVVKLMKP